MTSFSRLNFFECVLVMLRVHNIFSSLVISFLRFGMPYSGDWVGWHPRLTVLCFCTICKLCQLGLFLRWASDHIYMVLGSLRKYGLIEEWWIRNSLKWRRGRYDSLVEFSCIFLFGFRPFKRLMCAQ